MSTRDRETLRKRWPDVAAWLERHGTATNLATVGGAVATTLEVDGIRLESAVDPRGEAELQARLVPAEAERATLYGLGQGALARELLRRPSLRTLHVVLLAPGAVCAALDRLDHEWLHDPRVELVRGDAPPELSAPFAVVPAALRLAAPDCRRLADLVRLELATPHIRRHIRSQHETWRERSAANMEMLAADEDVSTLFDTARGERVVVAAAGPSLSEHLERLRARDCLLIAVDAALRPLLLAGVVPDVVVTVDGHEDGMKRCFDVPNEDLSGCTLVYSPVVVPAVVAAWPGPRRGAYAFGTFYDELEEELPRTRLWSSGSVLHPAVDLAVRTGASEIELCGADFAHVGGRTHVAEAAWETASSGRGPSVENGHGTSVPSQPNLVGYLRDLERYITAHQEVRWVNASRSGARIGGTTYRQERLVG